MSATKRAKRRQRRRITPGVAFLSIALIGALAFAVYVITVRDASQIPLIAAGGAVLGIVFLALAAYMLRSTWKAGVAARNGRALMLGCGGGVAAIIGMLCLAGAIMGFLLARSG
jgi:hypothetical protein